MKELKRVHQRLKNCHKCSRVCGPPVHGPALQTKVMLVGQAPGFYEGTLGRPFAYTAGKTLFKWFKESLGLDETEIREMVYFTAVVRCFPGKAKSGKGDRAPNKEEIENCREYIEAEVKLIKPEIILAVGKIAIFEVLKNIGVTTTTPLDKLVGEVFSTTFYGQPVQVIPLPHPSGVSRWPHSDLGKAKLRQALSIFRKMLSEQI